MAKSFYTLQSAVIFTLVLVILAGLKQGFVEAQSGLLPQEEGKQSLLVSFLSFLEIYPSDRYLLY